MISQIEHSEVYKNYQLYIVCCMFLKQYEARGKLDIGLVCCFIPIITSRGREEASHQNPSLEYAGSNPALATIWGLSITVRTTG